jgi:hypothetical protein
MKAVKWMLVVVAIMSLCVVGLMAQDQVSPSRVYITGVVKSVDADAKTMVVSKSGKDKSDVTVKPAEDAKIRLAAVDAEPKDITLADIKAEMFFRANGTMDGETFNAMAITVATDKAALARKPVAPKAEEEKKAEEEPKAE